LSIEKLVQNDADRSIVEEQLAVVKCLRSGRDAQQPSKRKPSPGAITLLILKNFDHV